MVIMVIPIVIIVTTIFIFWHGWHVDRNKNQSLSSLLIVIVLFLCKKTLEVNLNSSCFCLPSVIYKSLWFKSFWIPGCLKTEGPIIFGIYLGGFFVRAQQVSTFNSIKARRYSNKIVSCKHFWKKKVHRRKLTCPPKRDHFSREYIFQPLIFRGHVSFHGCNTLEVIEQKTKTIE